jgi:hypothetical protein
MGIVEHLALIFPGMGYGHGQALLRYSRQALEELGATVIPVRYEVLARWDRQGAFWSPERQAAFAAEVVETTGQVLTDNQPARLTLVGKSLGCHALAHVLNEVDIACPVRVVWLTPVWNVDETWQAARRCQWPSLYCVGLADPNHDPERHRVLSGRSITIEGGDHSLEVDGDVKATLGALERVISAVMEHVR